MVVSFKEYEKLNDIFFKIYLKFFHKHIENKILGNNFLMTYKNKFSKKFIVIKQDICAGVCSKKDHIKQYTDELKLRYRKL